MRSVLPHGRFRVPVSFFDIAGKSLRRAFTLLEVLIALALIGTVSILIVVSLDDLLASAQKPSPFEVLRSALDKAWYSAATNNTRLILFYDAEANAILVQNATGGGAEIHSFDDPRVTQINFARVPDDTGGIIGATPIESFPSLTISPSGGVTPAIIEMQISGELYRYQVEPFSGALEVLK